MSWVLLRREKTVRIQVRIQALQWSIEEDYQDSGGPAGVGVELVGWLWRVIFSSRMELLTDEERASRRKQNFTTGAMVR